MNELDHKRVICANLFFKATKDAITDSYFNALSNDCFELVKKNIPDDNLFQTEFINCYLTEQLPEVIPFTFGDYSL